nr:hypothetical protein [Tanacetum cinerariifolium]
MEILHFHANLVGHFYGMPRLLEEQPMPWTSHIQYDVVEAWSALLSIHGENYHRASSLLPGTVNAAYAQLVLLVYKVTAVFNKVNAARKGYALIDKGYALMDRRVL